MSSDFLTAHRLTMREEGGYANNPDDEGGPTYKGWARKFWDRLPLWKIIDWHLSQVPPQPPVSYKKGSPYLVWVGQLNARLEADSELQTKILKAYEEIFWRANRLHLVNDQRVANWLYDHAVNGGGRGIGWMQTAAGVTADGDIGPKSIAAINAASPTALLERAADEAEVYRLKRANEKPSQIQYLPSWLKRDGMSPQELRAVMFAASDGEISLAELKELTEMIRA
jgi:hypothetical protein